MSSAQGSGAVRGPVDAGEVKRLGEPLLEALEAHAPESRDRAESVATYAFAASVSMGHGREDAELIREVARLYGVGEIYVPAALLARPAESLSAAERRELDAVDQSGFRLCQGAGLPLELCEWLLASSTRQGAGANAGPQQARIIATARVTAALLAEGASGAAQRLRDRSRGLDPEVVEALAPLLERITP